MLLFNQLSASIDCPRQKLMMDIIVAVLLSDIIISGITKQLSHTESPRAIQNTPEPARASQSQLKATLHNILRLDCHGGSHGLCSAQITDSFPYLLAILGNSNHIFKIIISSVTSDFTKSVVYHILKRYGKFWPWWLSYCLGPRAWPKSTLSRCPIMNSLL